MTVAEPVVDRDIFILSVCLLVFIQNTNYKHSWKCYKNDFPFNVYMGPKMESTLNSRFKRVLVGDCDILYRKHFKGLIVLWTFQGGKSVLCI